MPVEMGRAAFEDLVESALDEIPEEIARLISNVVVLVEDDAPPRTTQPCSASTTASHFQNGWATTPACPTAS